MQDDTIHSGKQFAQVASELLDSEVEQVIRVHVSLQRKYAARANTAANLEAMRDEYVTRLADIGVLATVDPTPCFYGEPPVVEILGKVSADPIHKYGVDHEQKGYEINKANSRDEDYLGQKERVNARRPRE